MSSGNVNHEKKVFSFADYWGWVCSLTFISQLMIKLMLSIELRKTGYSHSDSLKLLREIFLLKPYCSHLVAKFLCLTLWNNKTNIEDFNKYCSVRIFQRFNVAHLKGRCINCSYFTGESCFPLIIVPFASKIPFLFFVSFSTIFYSMGSLNHDGRFQNDFFPFFRVVRFHWF